MRDAFARYGEALTRQIEEHAIAARDDLNAVFVEGDIEKLPGFQVFRALCRADKFSVLTPEKLRKWIIVRVRDRGPDEGPKNITPSAVSLLMKISEDGDLWRIVSEIEKLISYSVGRQEITEADVLALVRFPVEETIFPVSDGVCERNPEKALRAVARLAFEDEGCEGIITYTINEARNLVRARAVLDEGGTDMPKEFHINPFVWRKRMAQARRWGSGETAALLTRARDLDVAWKTGAEKRLALERFILAATAN